MKNLFILLLALMFALPIFSQEDEDDGDKFGANKTHFVHSYLNVGFMIPPGEGDGADILYGKSHSITYGVRYKFKIAEIFAIGAGINYTYNVWHLDQNDTKIVPTPITYEKEKIMSNNLGGDVFLRFNIGKHTNTVGNYIDLGGYGEWAFGTRSKVTTNFEDPNLVNSGEYATATLINLNYMEKVNYGLSARIGYGKFVLFGKYRMSDVFTKDYKATLPNDVEFPRLIIGFEIGFHK